MSKRQEYERFVEERFEVVCEKVRVSDLGGGIAFFSGRGMKSALEYLTEVPDLYRVGKKYSVTLYAKEFKE